MRARVHSMGEWLIDTTPRHNDKTTNAPTRSDTYVTTPAISPFYPHTGSFKKGEKHGQGVFYYPDDSRYDGEFRKNKRDGEGTYYYSNGACGCMARAARVCPSLGSHAHHLAFTSTIHRLCSQSCACRQPVRGAVGGQPALGPGRALLRGRGQVRGLLQGASRVLLCAVLCGSILCICIREATVCFHPNSTQPPFPFSLHRATR